MSDSLIVSQPKLFGEFGFLETITSWYIRQYGVLINVINLPNLPKNVLDWTSDQHNRFEDLIAFAYNHQLKEISWNEVQVDNRIGK